MEVIKLFDIPKEVINDNERQRRVYSINGISPLILSRSDSCKIMEVKVIGDLFEDNGHGSMAGRVYDANGQCPTIGASHFQQIKYILDESVRSDAQTVRIKQATSQGYIECEVGGVADLSFPESNTRRGRVQDKGQVSPTLMADETELCRIESSYRIRKLTPNECWRLMDITDEDFEKAAEVNSPTQLYKQAGNSICRNVLVAIIGQMLPGKENIYKEV